MTVRDPGLRPPTIGPVTTPLPDLILYGRPGCHLCEDARAALDALLAIAPQAGSPAPGAARARHRDRRGLAPPLPGHDPGRRVAAGDLELGLATSRPGSPLPGRGPRRADGAMSGDYTILVAVGGGPDLVPLAVRPAARARVPRPADRGRGRRPGWAAGPPVALGGGAPRARLRGRLRRGVHAARRHGDVRGRRARRLPRRLRIIGGVVLVVMGLSLAGILRIPRPRSAPGDRSMPAPRRAWPRRPAACPWPRRTAASAAASAAGSSAGRTGLGASFALGAIFAVGWTPCIGTILGGILTLAATSEGKLQGALLLVGYTLGLGTPVHPHRRVLRPLARPACGSSSATDGSSRSSAACSSRRSGWR